LADPGAIIASLSHRLAKAGLTSEQTAALAGAVRSDHTALSGLLLTLQGEANAPVKPLGTGVVDAARGFLRGGRVDPAICLSSRPDGAGGFRRDDLGVSEPSALAVPASPNAT